MGKLYNYSDIIKKKVFDYSMQFFGDTKFLYGINFCFSSREFSDFNDRLYSIYEYKNKVYSYENDVIEYLSMAVSMCFESDKKEIKLEDIYDAIWEVELQRQNEKSNKNNKADNVKKHIHRSRKIQEV